MTPLWLAFSSSGDDKSKEAKPVEISFKQNKKYAYLPSVSVYNQGKLNNRFQVSPKSHLPLCVTAGVPGFSMCQKQSSASSEFISQQALALQQKPKGEPFSLETHEQFKDHLH